MPPVPSPTDGDRGAARIATASALIVVAAFVAAKAARDALLLSSYAVTSLPIFTGAAAIVSLPLTVLAGRLMSRHGPMRLMPAANAVSAVLLVVEYLWVRHAPRSATIAIYFHLSVSGAVLVSGFWSIVNERFDVQTAKRHIGRIGMGATLGGIAGGLIAERTGAYIHHPEKVLLAIAVMQVLAAGALIGLGKRGQPEPAPAADESPWSGLRVVARSRLLRNLGLVVVLGAIAAGALDYVFKADLVRGTSHRELLRSLSLFYTVTNVITAILQVAVCGPLVARLGVPRTVAALPVTATTFGAIALAAPGAATSVMARGAELVVRNSIYRSGYELLYAPMSEEHKRPSKVVLDVGADKIGELLGAQLVAAIVYQTLDPRLALLSAAVAVGAVGVMVAMRLPASYRAALEESLLARAAEAEVDPPPPGNEPWITMGGLPAFGHPDSIPLARGRRVRERRDLHVALPGRATGPAAPTRTPADDPLLGAIAALRSNDAARIRGVLATPLAPELAPHALALVGRDEVARDAMLALHAIAPRCTGLLVDALLDPDRDEIVRRRLPAVLAAGEPQLAAWGLWHALGDPSFDVRYRAGGVLARLAGDGHLTVTADDVFDAVKRELLADPEGWKARRAVEDLAYSIDAPGDDPPRIGDGLEHVFTVLGLVLPAEPLRIALHAVQTDDPALRGTALEYLESILPPDIRAQLWPLLEGETPAAAAVESVAAAVKRTRDEILAELERTYPRVIARLRHRDAP